MSHCILFFKTSDRGFHDFFINKNNQLRDKHVKKNLRNITEIVRYCSEDQLCRRKMLLSYFGEGFDVADCQGMCDVCVSNRVCEPGFVDCFDHVLAVEKALFSSQFRSFKPSFNLLVEYLISGSGKQTKKQKKNAFKYEYVPIVDSIFKNFGIVEANKFVREMIYNGLIEEEFLYNQNSGMVLLKGNQSRFNLFRQSQGQASIYITAKAATTDMQRREMTQIQSANRRNYDQKIESSSVRISREHVSRPKSKTPLKTPTYNIVPQIGSSGKKELTLKDHYKIRSEMYIRNRKKYENVQQIITNKLLVAFKKKNLRDFSQMNTEIENSEGLMTEEHFVFLKQIFMIRGDWEDQEEDFVCKLIEYGYAGVDDLVHAGNLESIELSPVRNESNGKRKYFGLTPPRDITDSGGIFMNARKLIYDKKGYAMEDSFASGGDLEKNKKKPVKRINK